MVNAITAQNLTLPSGTEKIGRFEYLVGLNSSPDTIEKLNAIPIKSLANGTTIYIQKTGSASTLDIVQGVKNKITGSQADFAAGIGYFHALGPIYFRDWRY